MATASQPKIRSVVSTIVDGTSVLITALITVDITLIGNSDSLQLSTLELASKTVDDTGMLFIGDPFSIEIHLATAILLGPCATKGDHTLARYARYILSPFIDMGPSSVGIIHGAIATALIIAHGLATIIRSRLWAESFWASAEKVMFPSVSFVVAVVLFPGSIVAVVDMLRDGMSAGGMLLGILHAVWVAASMVAVAVRWPGVSTFQKAKNHRGPAQTLFAAAGRWCPESQRQVLGVRGFIVDSRWGRAFTLASIGFFTLMALTLFVTTAACGPRLFVGAVLCFVAAAVVGATRPLLSPFSNIATAVSCTAVGIVLLVHGIASVNNFSGAQGRGALWYIKMIALVILFVATLARTIHFGYLLLAKQRPKDDDDDEGHAEYEVDHDDIETKDAMVYDPAMEKEKATASTAEDAVIVEDSVEEHNSSSREESDHEAGHGTEHTAAVVSVPIVPTPYDDLTFDDISGEEDMTPVVAQPPPPQQAAQRQPTLPTAVEIEEEVAAGNQSDFSNESDNGRMEALVDDDGIMEGVRDYPTTDDESRYQSDASGKGRHQQNNVNTLTLPDSPREYQYGAADLDDDENNHF
eukprot:GILK01013266.1.p1 GENE.GILK01013266.1~~GILK01013266.1.p1  ORF type:complete len:599 (+),score=39.13 GILK01013266.1:54-1799(+)